MTARESRVDGRASRLAPCSQCGSYESTPVWAHHGFSYVRCNTCALVRVDPQLTQEAIDELYTGPICRQERDGPGPGLGTQPRTNASWTRSRDCARERSRADVGCFQGQLLWSAREMDGRQQARRSRRRRRLRASRVAPRRTRGQAGGHSPPEGSTPSRSST
jgi:hypothetical protein